MSQGSTASVRRTVQKEVIGHAMAEVSGFVSAQQLHRRLLDEGTPVGLATVYRQLNAMVESGQADTIALEGEQVFRMCDPDGHHHHLVCEGCGHAVEIEPQEEWIQAVARLHGFVVTKHVLEVLGRCQACQRAAEEAGPGSG